MVKMLLVFSVFFLLVNPGILATMDSSHPNTPLDNSIISKISTQIEIPAGSEYCIRFDSQTTSLQGQDIHPYSDGLSEKSITAIAKSPQWIQRDLTRQFQTIANPEPYAELLLNMSTKYSDEIAFSIACTPLGNPPSVDLIKDNVLSLYEYDEWIRYADIVDYNDGTGNYYSTIRYKVLENGEEKLIELPKDVYYWYVVHPKIAAEVPDFIYDTFWRSYYFNHNDIGYPLLKEKLSTIEYLWDGKSYSQPGNRLWTSCISEHPTAIEAVSYWVGKTVPYGAMGDRPGDPNVIMHEHNGYCGELQRIATAALRTALIPSIGACNVAEDHVWREFYERGWHENDNWWTDSGGAVNQPDVYAYGWGKNMSSIYAWKGDDSIYDVTSRYIHPEDRITVSFDIKNSYLQPVDGAQIVVLVNGLKDISWYKNFFVGKLQEVWDKLPAFLQGRIMQFLFDKIQTRISDIPNVIDGVTISTWNYTDVNGKCTFELGKNLEYTFLVQQGNLKKPWQLARYNTLRILSTHENKTFNIIIPSLTGRLQPHFNKALPKGDCDIDISFTSAAVQLQKSFRTDNIGTYSYKSRIDFFIVDQTNFEKYRSGKRFTCSQYNELEQGDFHVSTSPQDWYFVFRNHAQQTDVIVDILMQVELLMNQPHVQIVSPDTTIFDTPLYNVGDTVIFTGVATGNVLLAVNGISFELAPVNSVWSYAWNTVGIAPGEYVITASCGGASDEKTIRLIDSLPPDLRILKPRDGIIIEDDSLLISGQSSDNVDVTDVYVRVDDGEWRLANGLDEWSIDWDISESPLGDHLISAKAIDVSGLESLQTISFIVNESGHEWEPQINMLFHLPLQPTNTSNVIVFANVTTDSLFSIKNIVLYCNNGTTISEEKMYRYADYPVQGRHEEDPLNNQSNAPLYGVELGQLPSGETITYWIVAVDTANNTKTSDEQSFTVSG